MDTKLQHIISGLVLCFFLWPHVGQARNGPSQYGNLIGSFTNHAHDIKGTVYAVDETSLFVKGFHYDGTGPEAYFWVDNSTRPSPEGYLIPYPDNYKDKKPPSLKAHNNTDILLRLPLGKRLRDFNWLSVWCVRFTVAFGEVAIPPNIEIRKPRVLPEFSRLAHGLRSGNITILDSKAIYIPNLHYDGAGPDAYFWVGTGTEPHTLGIKVPNEVKSLKPLRGYQGEDIEIVLPQNLTVYDIDWLAVWCVRHKQNFGHVLIPKDLSVPPALGQTKIATSSTSAPTTPKQGWSNCKEFLEGRVQVQWQLIGEEVQIQVSGRIKEDQYIAFGLSGKTGKAEMLGADVVVVGYDNRTGRFIADDYYMSDFSQCDGKKGVCPDERVGGKNDATLVHGERNNGITTVIYRRPLRTNEPVKDKMIPEFETSVIAAIGPLNSRGEANAHQAFDKTTEDIRIDFTSPNVHECTNSLYNLPDMSDVEAWPQAVINDEEIFTARIGPAGGKRGYSHITGEPSWGIAWYINDLLIPEITVVRGRTYKFVVEGGNDPANSAKYHPFYITSSPEGGFGQRKEQEQREQRVFAGVAYDNEGYPYPTAAGRYCEWVHKTVDKSAESKTFESFFETLRLECTEGEPARFEWTVPEDAPDLLYYQCYAHSNLGWKIHVVDAVNGAASFASTLTIIITPIISIIALLR